MKITLTYNVGDSSKYKDFDNWESLGEFVDTIMRVHQSDREFLTLDVNVLENEA